MNRKRKLARRRDELTLDWEKVEFFFNGHVEGMSRSGCSVFATKEEARASWEAHRAAIMRMWETGLPDECGSWWLDSGYKGPRLGVRPWAWWMFDAPEPRRRIIGFCSNGCFGQGDIAAATEESIRFYWERFDKDDAEAKAGGQLPWNGMGLTRGENRYLTDACFESEREYLARLNLLNEREQAMTEDELLAAVRASYA